MILEIDGTRHLTGDEAMAKPPQPKEPFPWNWQPSMPVGPLGKEYGKQPPAITPPDEDPDFFKRFNPPPTPDYEPQ